MGRTYIVPRGATVDDHAVVVHYCDVAELADVCLEGSAAW